MTLSKAKLRVLERMFEKEINRALSNKLHGVNLPPIYQSKAKIMMELERDGLIQRHNHLLTGRFPVQIYGYLLTHAGRAAYCATCEMP